MDFDHELRPARSPAPTLDTLRHDMEHAARTATGRLLMAALAVNPDSVRSMDEAALLRVMAAFTAGGHALDHS